MTVAFTEPIEMRLNELMDGIRSGIGAFGLCGTCLSELVMARNWKSRPLSASQVVADIVQHGRHFPDAIHDVVCSGLEHAGVGDV
jgi:hypothetical protein